MIKITKSVYIYGSYRKNKTGVPIFWITLCSYMYFRHDIMTWHAMMRVHVSCNYRFVECSCIVVYMSLCCFHLLLCCRCVVGSAMIRNWEKVFKLFSSHRPFVKWYWILQSTFSTNVTAETSSRVTTHRGFLHIMSHYRLKGGSLFYSVAGVRVSSGCSAELYRPLRHFTWPSAARYLNSRPNRDIFEQRRTIITRNWFHIDTRTTTRRYGISS